jgi:hypothetical protein
MGGQLCAIAAALHGAPAPASGPRRVDEQQRAPRSLAPLESRGTRPAEDIDGVPRDRRHEVPHDVNAHPCPGRTRQQARNQARLGGQLVEDLAIALWNGPAIDERVGRVPDRRLQPDGHLEVTVTRLRSSHPDDVPCPALEIDRPPERLEPFQRPVRCSGPGRCKGQGEASRLEREHLSVGVMQLERADLDHVTILSGYSVTPEKLGELPRTAITTPGDGPPP